VLATQALVLDRPLTLRVRIEGRAQRCVGAKDIALALIARHGTDAANGAAVEFEGSVVTGMTIESRLTLCNLALEMGARFAFIAPDEITYSYLKGRRYAPTGAMWDGALAYWRSLASDPGAIFDREIVFDVSDLPPQISWVPVPLTRSASMKRCRIRAVRRPPSYERRGKKLSTTRVSKQDSEWKARRSSTSSSARARTAASRISRKLRVSCAVAKSHPESERG